MHHVAASRTQFDTVTTRPATGEEARTCSFYTYVPNGRPAALRCELEAEWVALNVLGRAWVAPEGVNAQVSVPTARIDEFVASIRGRFPEVPIKWALSEEGESFTKLRVCVKPSLVNDGLAEPIDLAKVCCCACV